MDELRWLLDCTARGPERVRIPGGERALVYRLAGEVGLRAAELASLERRSFDLDADQPTVTVKATDSKRRREDVLPLRSELAAILQEHLQHKLPGAKALTVPPSCRTAKTLRADLKAARAEWIEDAQHPQERARREQSDFLCYRDHNGHVADFHSLRHTFITNLGRERLPP